MKNFKILQNHSGTTPFCHYHMKCKKKTCRKQHLQPCSQRVQRCIKKDCKQIHIK